VDEQDNVIGHESKYNCTSPRTNPPIPFKTRVVAFFKIDCDIGIAVVF
jgi:hypothetical protein